VSRQAAAHLSPRITAWQLHDDTHMDVLQFAS